MFPVGHLDVPQAEFFKHYDVEPVSALGVGCVSLSVRHIGLVNGKTAQGARYERAHNHHVFRALARLVPTGAHLGPEQP
jgi:hypothetical protein